MPKNICISSQLFDLIQRARITTPSGIVESNNQVLHRLVGIPDARSVDELERRRIKRETKPAKPEGRPRLYPIDLLEPGQSFTVPRELERYRFQSMHPIYNCMKRYQSKTGKQFTSLASGDHIRILRVS